MVNHFYREYLNDDNQYKLVKEFWINIIDDIVQNAEQMGEWNPWKLRTFMDGTIIARDMLAIFDAYNERQKKAITIYQSPASSDDMEIAAWIESFDFSDSGGAGPAQELIVNLALSDESVAVARALLEFWVEKNTSPTMMQRKIIEQKLLLRSNKSCSSEGAAKTNSVATADGGGWRQRTPTIPAL